MLDSVEDNMNYNTYFYVLFGSKTNINHDSREIDHIGQKREGCHMC